MLTEEEFFCLEGCRTYKQYHQMRRGFERGTCTFCRLDRKLNKVLFETSTVLAWHVPRQYLRPELRYQGLVVPKRHVRFVTDLSDEEALDVHHALQYLNQHFGYQGGLIHAREGDMRLNAGTVPHLHYNIFEPNGTGEVRVPVFKDQSDRAENQARAAGFAARYEADELPAD